MNIIFISAMTNKQSVLKNMPSIFEHNIKFFPLNYNVNEVKKETQTDIIIADAMAKIGDDVISSMKNLKLIQSEGVGYQGIDLESAKKHNVIVCNNKGVNNSAVAEHTVMLILSLLKKLNEGDIAIRDGKQIEMKQREFGKIRELSQCVIGLIGFGDIAKQTAKYLNAFGAKVLYSNRTRYENLEKEYNISYVSQDELLNKSDFVSLHVATSDETRSMADENLFKKMKKSAYLINTSRGDLVDNAALYNALKEKEIAGAGLDVISPEPVMKDNILLFGEIKDNLVLTPHIAGITSLTMEKIFKNLMYNINAISNNETPINIIGE